MPKTIEAVYENGVFKPVKKIKLPEHELVKLVITPLYEDEEAVKRLVEKQKKALKKVIGIGSSDSDDGSINHDKYLYGKPCGSK
ncbi:MAG: antitoxin family protein [Candidatus Schekmanbacteria bacterium]|nr:antitoxin family protein [Candidatus Schekmanbacteria bacterium]